MSDMQKVYEYFMQNEFTYKSGSVLELSKVICEKDKEMFNFDIRTCNHDEQFETLAFGIRRYFLKEDCIHPFNTAWR